MEDHGEVKVFENPVNHWKVNHSEDFFNKMDKKVERHVERNREEYEKKMYSIVKFFEKFWNMK